MKPLPCSSTQLLGTGSESPLLLSFLWLITDCSPHSHKPRDKSPVQMPSESSSLYENLREKDWYFPVIPRGEVIPPFLACFRSRRREGKRKGVALLATCGSGSAFLCNVNLYFLVMLQEVWFLRCREKTKKNAPRGHSTEQNCA